VVISSISRIYRLSFSEIWLIEVGECVCVYVSVCEGTVEKEMNKLYVNCFPLGQKRFVLALAN
jgi:hypothetical protein